MASPAYGSLPFREQIEFFRKKLNLPTRAWTDIWTHEHDWAFVVAGANRDAIVADFREAVQAAIDDGTTLQDFRKQFDAIVAKHGWDYNGGRNWRSRVIYETNLNTSYAAGRYQQLQAAPYWQYIHADWVTHPRHDHLAWHGMILRADDPFWDAHFPPNGWGCQCSVRGLWDADLERLGKDGPDAAPQVNYVERTVGQRSPSGPRTVRVPDGIDPGFEYTPGKARMESAIPPERPDLPGSAGAPGLPNTRPSDPMPARRKVPSDQILPPGQEPQDYAAAFLRTFGATIDQPVIVRDVIDERIVVGAELFQTPRGQWKADKQDRGLYMLLLAQALIDPDEVWVRVEWNHAQNRAMIRRRYIAAFDVDDQDTPALVVFDRGADGWHGVTAFQGTSQRPDDWRVGVRLYRRGDRT